MVTLVTSIQLAAYALGAFGAGLIFMEFFQQPNYVRYNKEFNDYTLEVSPSEVREYTWIGRVGAFLLAVAFALQFLAVLLG
jgi:hypothetical protein